ncbi:MAG: glycoside hydrolase [Actinomycetota bacterium]|nr:glycoside hydrolase [Actinomycetota bacterium]
MIRPRMVAAGVATAAIVGALALPATATGRPSGPAGPSASAQARGVPRGCRPAVSHLPGGLPAPRSRPAYVCGGSTGFGGAESHLVVTRSGAVVFTPAVLPQGLLGTGTAPVPLASDTQSNASPAGQAVSRDGGRSWQLVKPLGATWNPTDHGDYADPVTGRLFFADYGPIPLAPQLGAEQEGPAHLMWSPDDGRTWHHSAVDTVFLPENPRFTSAPPPTGQPAPAGYPDVVYFCANTNVGFVSPVIGSRRCFASLDGGSSWTEKGTVLRGSAPVHPECGTSGESYSAIDGSYPQPASDGSLYLMVACGGATYLARSTDEAATFPILHRASGAVVTLPLPAPATASVTGSSDLRIGPDNTFYLVDQETRESRNTLLLRVSRDLGRTWSRPIDLLGPGLDGVLHWAMAQRGGRIAVAYLGHRPGEKTWDGWLASVSDAATSLAIGRPLVLTTGQVNDRARPLLYGDQVMGAGTLGLPAGPAVPFPPPFDIQVFGNDFIGADIGPDGTVWGSFTQDCGPAPGSSGCVAQRGQTRGYAGRLVSSP